MTETLPVLTDLARSGDFEACEQLWLESIRDPGPLATYFPVLEVLVESKQPERADALANSLADALCAQSREKEVLNLYEQLADLGLRQISGLRKELGAWVRERYGHESWYPFVVRVSDFDEKQPRWPAFLQFREALGFVPGRIVLHRSGWGEGVVEALDAESEEIAIQFSSGATRELPWRSALDTLTPLPEWDLRSMRLRDPEGLWDFAKEDPAEVIRRALRLYRGKATSTQMKEFLHGEIVPAKSWTSWWKKAKAAAVEDPMVEVSGSSARPVFVLRKRALTLLEELTERLRHERQVPNMIREIRAYLQRATREEDSQQIVEFARQRLESKALADEPSTATLEALAFLHELGQVDQERAQRVLRRFMNFDPERPQRLDFRPLFVINDPELRRFAVSQIPDMLGERWHEYIAGHLKGLPEEGLEELLERFREDATTDELLEVYSKVAPFPGKHPFLLFLLTKAFADGAFAEAGDRVDPNVVVRVILHVLRHVSDSRHASPSNTKLKNRIVTLLIGKKGMLEEQLTNADQKTVSSALHIGLHATEDYPAKVQETVEMIARHRFPQLFTIKEPDFWENEEVIYTSKEGLDAFREEFIHLRDVKIPANSKAIGAAASQGDLSENAEWDAALEDQRNLTNQANEMEEKLKRAKDLREIEIPDGVVAPGTRVVVEDLDEQRTESYRILGPWDGRFGDDIISYLAPLAGGLLGLEAGGEATVELPTGQRRLRVLEIERLF